MSSNLNPGAGRQGEYGDVEGDLNMLSRGRRPRDPVMDLSLSPFRISRRETQTRGVSGPSMPAIPGMTRSTPTPHSSRVLQTQPPSMNPAHPQSQPPKPVPEYTVRYPGSEHWPQYVLDELNARGDPYANSSNAVYGPLPEPNQSTNTNRPKTATQRSRVRQGDASQGVGPTRTGSGHGGLARARATNQPYDVSNVPLSSTHLRARGTVQVDPTELGWSPTAPRYTITKF